MKGRRTQSDGSLAIVLVTVLQTATKQDSIATRSNRSDASLAMFLVPIIANGYKKKIAYPIHPIQSVGYIACDFLVIMLQTVTKQDSRSNPPNPIGRMHRLQLALYRILQRRVKGRRVRAELKGVAPGGVKGRRTRRC